MLSSKDSFLIKYGRPNVDYSPSVMIQKFDLNGIYSSKDLHTIFPHLNDVDKMSLFTRPKFNSYAVKSILLEHRNGLTHDHYRAIINNTIDSQKRSMFSILKSYHYDNLPDDVKTRVV